MESKRIGYFDWIRGCMILWMLVYHISLNFGYIKFGVAEDGSSIFTIMSFFMAPFYVISGYFFKPCDFKSFIKNKIRKLFVPYCTFTIFGIIIFEMYCLIKTSQLGSLQLLQAIPTGGFRANTPMWFFISLFFCNTIYYLIYRRGKLVNLTIILCCIMAYLTHNQQQILGYGNVLLGLTFFHFGVFLKKNKDQLRSPYYAVLGVIICLIIAIFSPTRLEFVRNFLVQGNYLLNYTYTISACFVLWAIAQMWKHNNIIGRSLIYLGRNSLVVYAFHRPVLNWIVEPTVRFVYPNISYPLFLLFCLSSLLSLYLLLNYILKNNLPILIAAR